MLKFIELHSPKTLSLNCMIASKTKIKTRQQAHGDWEEGITKLSWPDRDVAKTALTYLNSGL